jgi:nondiscriminating glutamyl-tRNA synthetase
MNWLFTRHAGGRFILRIEDTDQQRSSEEAERAILEDLKWLRLDWDEGPFQGGTHGPYRQSERIEFYGKYIQQLENEGKAYPCYCTSDELENRRKERLARGESTAYDGRCRNLSQAEKQKLEDQGRLPAMRFPVNETTVRYEDLVKAVIEVQGENLGDFILVRPDGMPMYNFACVVDDHLMEISHVIRGDDHVSNTPRQILLYRAFGWSLPEYAHIPMILGQDRVRLSKRHGATSVTQYREEGYLPDALINFLSLLSWSSESGDEILSMERLIDEFDFSRVSKSSAVFDTEKLKWMNGVYIRQLDLDTLAALALPFLQNGGMPVSKTEEIKPIVGLLQEKLEQLTEFPEKARIFFQDKVIPENKEVEDLLSKMDSQSVLNAFLAETSRIQIWDKDTFHTVMKNIQKTTDIKGKSLWMPIRAALTGQMHGPDLSGIAHFFGLEKCRRFMEDAVRK